jgi:C-methyltransferase-like protein/putative zinc binding protein/methyltransferase family protein
LPSSAPLSASTADATTIESCRSCGSDRLEIFLDLGELPLPDALVSPEELEAPEARYPLDVAFCPDCSLVQIRQEVPPEQLFVHNNLYFSSFSSGLLAHCREHALNLIETRSLGQDSLVVEVASNDGYMLKNFVEQGVPALGIDPGPPQAAAAIAAGVPTLQEFFDADLARRLRAEGRRADVIIANNVMAHTPTLNSFVEGLSILLADDGIATIENTYVKDLIDHCEFDTIYHEHFSYFSCTAVDALMRRHGLKLLAVDHFPALQGGSLRWTVGRGEVQESAKAFLAAEREQGLTEFGYYREFGERVEGIRRDLRALLTRLREEGKSVVGYGAAAKGSTLLNFTGVDGELLDYVVDRNTHKHGLHMPGVHVPIHAPERLLEDQPDYVLLVAWNYKDEVVAQQAEYLERGGTFIVPVPAVEIL